MNTFIIAIGSNIEAEKNISQMLEWLAVDVEILQVSGMIKTKPIGITDQADFTNGAVKIKTSWNFEELNLYLKNLENRLGRDRTKAKFGPRCIDLDILIFNNKITDDDYFARSYLQQLAKELGF